MKVDGKKSKKRVTLLGIFFLIGLAAHGVIVKWAGQLLSQEADKRWDPSGGSSQISVFYPDQSGLDPESMDGFRFQMEKMLEEESISGANPKARSWTYAYSGKGSVQLESKSHSLTTTAYGVGGDFFLFHPLVLKEGSSYLTSFDENQDRVLLDENAAWRLFGSYDVAGQEITIGSQNSFHIGVVAGVVESESKGLNKKAGAEEMTVYLSYDLLKKYGSCREIQNIEVVMPNPIKDFAYNQVKNLLGVDETRVEILENSSRFSFWNRWKILGEFGTRSMNTKSVIYPYWENAARGTEDILSVFTILETVSFLVVLILFWLLGKDWLRVHPIPVKKVWRKLEAKREERKMAAYQKMLQEKERKR